MSRDPRGAAAVLLTVLVWCVAAVPPVQAQSLAADEAAALRQELDPRFEIVALARGLGLVPRESRGLVEIDEGVISIEGRPLSGAELRERFGADAPILLRLSYLSNLDLRLLLPASLPQPPAQAAETSVPPPVEPPPPSPPAAAPAARVVPEATPRAYRRSGARLSIGRSVTVAEDEEVSNGVVVVGGRLHINGRVRDEVVVVGGNVVLGPTAEVFGDITVIGGSVDRAPGARHIGRVNDAMFGDWRSGRWHGRWWPSVEFGGWLSLAGALFRVTLLALCVALVLLVARRPVLRVGETAAAAPWQAAIIGLGAQLLFVPLLIVVSIALAVTIIGIPFVAVLVPLAIVAAFLALLLGFTGMVARVGAWIGARMGSGVDSLLLAAWLGLGLVVLPTLVARTVGVAPAPFHVVAFSLMVGGAIVEYVVWTIGLGAALMTGFGRWSTVPPPVPPVAEPISG